MQGTVSSDQTNDESVSVAVKLDSVTKRFGDIVAAAEIELSIRDGEYLTLLGPSGAGKTTLLQMIAGFVQPTDGEIYIGADPVSHKAPYERDIGMVFQDLALFPHMTVRQNISFPLKMRGEFTGDFEDKIVDVLELVQLPVEYMDKPINELSGGQQQRVAIARAIVYEPTLLLLDEPLSSLDKKLRDEMRSELLRIHNETDLTIIHVTHNQTEALSISDRVAVFDQGELVQIAQTQQVYLEPKTPFVADFIGNTTLLEGSLTEDGVVDTGELIIEITDTGEASVGDSVTVGIRAERVRIDPDDSQLYDMHEMTVEELAFEGENTQYELDFGANKTIQARVPNAEDYSLKKPGEKVAAGWDPDDLHVFLQ